MISCPHCGGPVATRKDAKASKRQAKRDADASVRRLVMARSRGRCEACGEWRGDDLELDHFWGRSRDRTPFGCWALCSGCHAVKTRNQPSRLWWLERFRKHVSPLAVAQIIKCDEAVAKVAGKRRSP